MSDNQGSSGGDASGGAASTQPGSALAGKTFSQSPSATTGLTDYRIERGTKTLYPTPGVGKLRGLRSKARALLARHRHLRKDSSSMHDTIEAMVGTLSKSVLDVVAAAPPNTEELLNRNFDEFAAELKKQAEGVEAATLEKIADENIIIEPLYKSLGHVGKLATLVQTIAHHADMLKNGKDYPGQSEPPRDAVKASPEVSALLDHLVTVSTMALSHAVNEHCEPADDDDDGGDGIHVILVPSADDDADMTKAYRLKSSLPEELLKCAADPDHLARASIELGAMLMLEAGVPEQQLSKLFEEPGEPLAKAFPPPKKKPGEGDASGDAADASAASASDGSSGSGDATAKPPSATDATGADQSQDVSVDPNDAGDSTTDDDDDPLGLDVLGRLLAAAMIQVNFIQQQVYGDGSGDDAGAGDMAGDPGAGSPPPPMSKRAPVHVSGKAPADPELLEKIAASETRAESAEKELTEIKERLAKIEAQPVAPKGLVGAAAALSLSKVAETGGTDNTDDELQKIASRLDRLPPGQMREEALAQELIKIAQRRPIPVPRAG